MKLEDWKLQPVKKSGSRKGAVTTTTSDGIKVQTMVATKNNRKVILHRVEKTLPNGKKEIFIIKASAKDLEINH